MTDSFLKYIQLEKRYSPQTVISYETDLRQFQEFLAREFDGTLPQDANHGLVRSWIVSLVEAKMDATSINRKIACLRSYYKFLMRHEIIKKSPMYKIMVLKAKKKLPHFVPQVEMIHLLDEPDTANTFESARDRLVLELLYGTGMRRSELINLKDSALNLRDGTVKVLGKRNKERVIPFTSKLVSLLKGYMAVRNKEVEKKEPGFLLVSKHGDALSPAAVGKIVKSALKHVNVEKKSPHVLRHSYATHLLNEGAEINAVKDLLGHTSLAATQVYTHNSIEKLKKVFEKAHPKA